MTAVFLVLLFVLIALNGVFVAAEFALVRSRRTRIEQLAAEGSRGASSVLDQLDRIDEYLSACQLGITMASIGIGFLGEPAVAQLIEPIFGSLSHGVAVGISVAIAYALVTTLHVVVGEQAPKMFAISRPEDSARSLAAPLRWFRRISAPFTVALTWMSNALVRLFGVRPGELQDQPTTEDLKVLISQSAVGGDLDPGEAVMLRGVFHLHEQEARGS
jgi:CBS domain containing-hemolysin-like protein